MFNFQSVYFSRDRIKALILLLMVGLVYLPFLKNPLIFDDLTLLGGGVISGYADLPFNFDLRWFPYVSLGFTWVFFGEDPPAFRVQNLLLHGMNVLLLLLLLRLWIGVFIADASKEKMANWGAWLGALVFACHPLAVYGVGYLVQRSILMATLFTLLMQLAYLRGLLENKKRYLALAVAAYFLAVFSKEHSLLAPAILLPLTWVLHARNKFSPRVLLVTWLGFALVGLLAVLSLKQVAGASILGAAYEADAASLFGQQDMLQGAPALHLLSVLTQAVLFFKYCLLMLVPNPAWMSVDMRETFLLSWRDWTNWIGLLAFVGYGVFALRCLLRGGRIALLGLALLYPWLLFMTEFSTVRVQEIFVLYRSYLWLPGFMLLAPLLVSALPDRKIMWAGALAVLLLVPLAWNRLWVFADNYRLWNDVVQLLHSDQTPGANRIFYNRGQAAAALHKWDEAIADFQRAVTLSPQLAPIHHELGFAYLNAGRYQDALAQFDAAIALKPDNASFYYGKAMSLKRLHRDDLATQQMEKSCELKYMTACVIVKMNAGRK
ncbi:MAG: tetratricopeptide repeat protein [Gallionellaceae bacterium]|jgi:tetratricopeptide (TPR) repeat protein